MKTSFTDTLLSILVLGAFVWLAAGSLDWDDSGTGESPPVRSTRTLAIDPDYIVPYYVDTISGDTFLGNKFTTIRRGNTLDDLGRWNGEVSTEHLIKSFDGEEVISREIERGSYRNGVRHGTFARLVQEYDAFSHLWYTVDQVDLCFNMGVLVRCSPDKKDVQEDPSAFLILKEKFLWFLKKFNAMEIEDPLVEDLMDALEQELAGYEIVEQVVDYYFNEFDGYFDMAVSNLSETEEYRDIITYLNLLSMDESADIIRGNEFRMAVHDRFRSATGSTYGIIKTTYPGYISFMNFTDDQEEIFQSFCQIFDNHLDNMGALDPEDPYYVDSIDMHLIEALFLSMAEEKKASNLISTAKQLISTGNLQESRLLMQQQINRLKDSEEIKPADFGFIVLYLFILDSYKGDLVRQAMRDAYFYGQIRPPVVTTFIPETDLNSGVSIAGTVIEDGGSEVTARGIVWGTIYNPTVDNSNVSSGNGTGEFAVTLTGLTEGQSYYARAYAINSKWTAYGNTIGFTGIADAPTGMFPLEEESAILSVFPVPARDMLHVVFNNEQTGKMVVSIVNMKGQLVSSQVYESAGRQQVSLNVQGFSPGIYILRLDHNGKTTMRKVLLY
jgi:hypothetical protein